MPEYSDSFVGGLMDENKRLKMRLERAGRELNIIDACDTMHELAMANKQVEESESIAECYITLCEIIGMDPFDAVWSITMNWTIEDIKQLGADLVRRKEEQKK